MEDKIQKSTSQNEQMAATPEQQQLLSVLLGNSVTVTIADALNGNSKQLSSLKHEIDEETALDVLKIFITSLVNSLNIGKNMSDFQIDETCILIMEDFWHLKVADLQLFVKEAKKGKFGKLYDRIDCQIIIEWLTVYDEERMSIAARQKPKALDLPEPTLPKINITGELPVAVKLYEKVREPVKPTPLPVNTDPIYQMHQKWFKQFDTLWARQGYPPRRFIQRYGIVNNPKYVPGAKEPKFISRKISVNEFMEHKQWQYEQYIERKTNKI